MLLCSQIKIEPAICVLTLCEAIKVRVNEETFTIRPLDYWT